ncbi:hypothetical protein DL93DRAFT_328831 [Clavulina sp. PMI_390]|nr:hypothetical protein DL93DRAFT_328831 [Clavulina sp. PMI_390]
MIPGHIDLIIVSQPSRPKKKTSFVDHVIRAGLVSFALWAAWVCPSDTRLENPSCRAIESWRLTIAAQLKEPVQTLLSHPSIEPVITTITPHYHQAVRLTTPIVRSIQVKAAPHLHALTAQVDELSKPYVRKAQVEYDARVRPYVEQVQPYYDVTSDHVQRGWVLAQTHLGPHVSHAQKIAKEQWEVTIYPKVVIPAWEQLQLLPGWVDDQVGDHVRGLKSTYIDAQLGKMWAKIEELSGRSTVASVKSTSTSSSPSTPVISVLSKKASSVVESVISQVRASTSSVEEKVAATTLTVVEDAAPTTAVPTSSMPSAEPEPTPTSATLSVAESIEPSISSSTAPASSSVAPVASTPELPEETVEADPVEEAADPEPEEDPLAFLEEFTAPSTTAVAEPVQQTWTPPTEEQIAQRQRDMVEKRRDLERRHSEWEAKIDAAGRAALPRVAAEVARLREEALESLTSTEDPESIGAQIAAFRAEGGKAIKGTKAYVDKLMSGKYHGAEKIGLFDSVVKKVDTRYTEGAKTLSENVAAWWADLRNRIDNVVLSAKKEMDDIGSDGQADLGMDYSYLDDVTTGDWSRYHDLLRRSGPFVDKYNKIVDGTLQGAPADPIPAALADLQEQLRQLVSDFQADLLKARDEGFRTIKGKPVVDKPGSSPSKPSQEAFPAM